MRRYIAIMFWSRPLLTVEQQFITRFFGDALVGVTPHVRLGLRRLGDTRRALCLNGGWMSFPRDCFEQGRPGMPLRLSHPQVAGLFAHELLHQLQRDCGLAVTRQALVLQARYLLAGEDPYFYSASCNPYMLVRAFWRAQVEQQAQMWQDHVQAEVAGTPVPALALVAQAVRARRLRPRARLAPAFSFRV